jgi:hypothetical protein
LRKGMMERAPSWAIRKSPARGIEDPFLEERDD